jgi:hypothetical protein
MTQGVIEINCHFGPGGLPLFPSVSTGGSVYVESRRVLT